ncbi:MAG: hypothetical protein ACKVP5_17910 [Aestuariivirga sp.]
MVKWSKWIPIEDATARNGRFAGMFGLYQIRAVSRSAKPIPIARLVGVDKQGLLYLGRSGHQKRSSSRTIPNRLKEFVKQHHSGGKTYARAARIMRRLEKFSKHHLEVCALSLRDRAINKAETTHLRRYFGRFGELPPCNSTLPSIEVIGG